MSVYKRKEESLKGEHRDYNDFKRARYFHGMLMTDRDFTEEQIYLNEKRKLLNQRLHGWGVVCGLKVKPTTTAGPNIVVEPGLALDCRGNEILVCEEQTIDLSAKVCSSTRTEQSVDCGDIPKGEQEHPTLYVMIKYKERFTDQVSVYAPGGSCEEKVCDYNRTQEGYCIEVWDSLPAGYRPPPVTPKSDETACKDPFPCPDINCCPDPHYILLATISCGPRKDVFGKRVANDGSEIRYWIERTLDKVCIQGNDEIVVTDRYAFETVGPININEENAEWTLDWNKLKNLEVVGRPVEKLQGREPEVTYNIKAKAGGDAWVLKVPITLKCDKYTWTITEGSIIKSTIRIGTTDVKHGNTISEAMIRNLELRKYVPTFSWFAWLLAENGEELPWSGDLSAYCTAENLIVTRADVMREVAKVKEDLRKETEARIKKIETDYRKKFVEMDKTIKGMTTKK